MAKYSDKDALKELKSLESKLLSRTEELLKDKKTEIVAGMLLSIDNELYETEREARRLRLRGELDINLYHTLTEGYSKLKGQIIQCATKFGLEDDVRSMYTFHRHEALRSRARG